MTSETNPTINIPSIGEVTVFGDNSKFYFEYAEMYNPPDLSFKILREWAEYFETEEIDTSDHISVSGCETCDYGSRYGFCVYIVNAKKNLPF